MWCGFYYTMMEVMSIAWDGSSHEGSHVLSCTNWRILGRSPWDMSHLNGSHAIKSMTYYYLCHPMPETTMREENFLFSRSWRIQVQLGFPWDLAYKRGIQESFEKKPHPILFHSLLSMLFKDVNKESTKFEGVVHDSRTKIIISPSSLILLILFVFITTTMSGYTLLRVWICVASILLVWILISFQWINF